MWKASRYILRECPSKNNLRWKSSTTSVPESADVVVIGGGSAGCHTLYHLAKRGIKAVLLERAKLTAGTTWHTSGLVWRLRPNDVDVQLLANSRDMLRSLEKETGVDPGWSQNGGLFIAHSKTRMDEYKRLATIGNSLGIENYVLSSKETQKVFPLLDPEAFVGSLYSPGDGTVDPTMLCTALTKSATENGGRVIEDCSVNDLLVEETSRGKRIWGVSTSQGDIKTNLVVNATGVWGKELIEKHGSCLPLVAMKHAYVVSETIPGVRGLPNVRDHDSSTYFRIQGDSIMLGGYEGNPILLDKVPNDFQFSLYELDWSTFDEHMAKAMKLWPTLEKHGVKSTVCGPESFTPDHKPLMGPDPVLNGLFHNCGFNSAGMMFGGGCGEQTAIWVINGKPDLPMFNYDIRRFCPQQTHAKQWAIEKAHESYANNYSLVFKHEPPLAGRNLITDPLHADMLDQNAYMEEKQGWERPAFFLPTGKAEVTPYEWYGYYGNKRSDSAYEKIQSGDYKYSFSDHQKLIEAEALACRNNAAVFNLSYFCKMYLEGPQAKEAADWIFTADTRGDVNNTIYSCVLNDAGGVESNPTVSLLSSGSGAVHSPKFDGQGYYIVADGASGYYTYQIILSEIREMGFQAKVRDVTADMGVLSIQGPKSREILQRITEFNLTDEKVLPTNSTQVINVRGEDGKTNHSVRIIRVSYVGELGYELHIPNDCCSSVYRSLMNAGKQSGLRNAGYRAFYSLTSESGFHSWGSDLRSDDTPIEANLGFVCRPKGSYKGKSVIDKQQTEGVQKRLAYFTLHDKDTPLWGLEGVYRNGETVGLVRRGEYAFYLDKVLGQAYIARKDEKPVTDEFVKSGKYQIEIMGKLYDADCHLMSPFDPESKRVSGIY